MTAASRKIAAMIPLPVIGGILASFAFAAIAFAQDADEKCLENVNQICNGADADNCFANESNWNHVLPECIGDVQTLVEMANEAKAEMMKEGASLGGKVRSGPGTKFGQIASLVEGDLVSLEENSGVMLDGYPWFKIVQYDNRTGAETLSGYQWGGILCAFEGNVEGVFNTCPRDWSDNPDITDAGEISEQPIAPHYVDGDENGETLRIIGAIEAGETTESTIRNCLALENAAGRDGSECINQYASACNEHYESYAKADTICSENEYRFWDDVLNDQYRKLAAILDTQAKKDSLRETQRLWIEFRDKLCPLSFTFTQGSMHKVTVMDCNLRTTASQAFELYRLVAIQSEPQTCAITYC